jgi:hypothetical protein
MISVIYVEIEVDEKTKRERKIFTRRPVRWGVLSGLQALESKPLGKSARGSMTLKPLCSCRRRAGRSIGAALEMTSRKRATDAEVTAARDAWAGELRAARGGRDFEIVG